MADHNERKPRPSVRARGARPENDAAMGAALRSVYQQTVEERVPDEFLDLLGKLG